MTEIQLAKMWQETCAKHQELAKDEIANIRTILEDAKNKEVHIDFFDDDRLDYDVERLYINKEDGEVCMETNDSTCIHLCNVPEIEVAIIFQAVIQQVTDNLIINEFETTAN